MVFPKKSEYVPVQKNFPEIFSSLGKNKGFTYLMYIAILYYMLDYYDNYENCVHRLEDCGYVLFKTNELSKGSLYGATYLKDDNHICIGVFYGCSGAGMWCNMSCTINYSGKMGSQFWECLASTYKSHAKEQFRFNLCNAEFLDILCNNDYNTVEMAFRRHEMEKSLEVLDGV